MYKTQVCLGIKAPKLQETLSLGNTSFIPEELEKTASQSGRT